MKKNIFKILLILLVFLFGLLYTYLMFNPIFIQNNNISDEVSFPVNCNKGEKVFLFKDFNFDEANWKACVLIHERYDISSDMPCGRYLITNNIKLLNELKKITFEYTESDIATVQNELILYKDDSIIFRCKIVIDDNLEGLQSSKFGWLKVEKGKLSSIIKDFNRNFYPFVFI